MINQTFQTSRQQIYRQWKKQYIDKGILQNEGEVLLALHNNLFSANEAADLYVMLANTKINEGKSEQLVRSWMEEALKLNPDHVDAVRYMMENNWKSYNKMIENLQFPPLRETDTKPTRKQSAEQYLTICQTFLNECDDLIQNIDFNTDMDKNIDQFVDLLNMLKEEVELLQAAVDKYIQSIVGMFYNSAHYQEVKIHVDMVEQYKQQFGQLFQLEVDNQIEEKNPLDELEEMIGLHTVKKRIHDLYHFLKYQKKRKELGYQTIDDLSLNMVITGNPGTGKTTIARLLAKIYHQLGVLPKSDIVETDRSQLVGAFVGQTEENVRAIVERSIGGVLFIDEAYSLKREGQSGNDYGQTAIDTLVSLMTSQQYAGKFAVILAGYPEEMRQFLDGNTGLRSRFPQSNFIHLPDYTNADLVKIAEKLVMENDYLLTNGARKELEYRIDRERVDQSFGNARTAKDIVLDAIFNKGSKDSDDSMVHYTLLQEEDFVLETIKETSSPEEKLSKLIGLASVKEEVSSLISFVKMQQFRRNQGLPVVPIQLHAVFTGNPGTGKTTVASIFAEFLKECGMLKRGHLIVASRADFVAGYVGQTAIKTKKKIREALGGVLFIDEAYSLLSHSSGDFGKEVIDTLVDEMTKHNENLVVILAGYPNEMRNLLNSNPGLYSRFKKFIEFPDYSHDELLEIMKYYAEKYHYKISEDGQQYIREYLLKTNVDGNGRFATNVVDESIQVQAMRLFEVEIDSVILNEATILSKFDVQKGIQKVRKGE